MICSRQLTGTEEHFINEALRFFHRFKKEMDVVFITEVRRVYETYRDAGLTIVGNNSISWNDHRPSPVHPPRNEELDRRQYIAYCHDLRFGEQWDADKRSGKIPSYSSDY